VKALIETGANPEIIDDQVRLTSNPTFWIGGQSLTHIEASISKSFFA
jgi:hypothetical protein